MAVDLVIAFPSEADALERRLRAQQGLSVTERLQAVDDLLQATEALARAGGMEEAQRARRLENEMEWRRRMLEFIRTHVNSQQPQ